MSNNSPRLTSNNHSASRENVLNALNMRKPQHPPDMYYIRRNPQMLERFLSDEDRLLREFMSDSNPQNAKLYQLFKVNQTDMDNYQQSIMPVKREKSPHDPYFKKLEYKPYHGMVHKTNEIFKKLKPHESRRMTDDQVIQEFLDQEQRFYLNQTDLFTTQDTQLKKKLSDHVGKKMSQMSFPNKHMKVRANPDEARKLNRISKDLRRNQYLMDVEDTDEAFEEDTNQYFNDQMDKEGTSDVPIMHFSDRNKRLENASRDQDKMFASMLNSESFDKFKFAERANPANVFSPSHQSPTNTKNRSSSKDYDREKQGARQRSQKRTFGVSTAMLGPSPKMRHISRVRIDINRTTNEGPIRESPLGLHVLPGTTKNNKLGTSINSMSLLSPGNRKKGTKLAQIAQKQVLTPLAIADMHNLGSKQNDAKYQSAGIQMHQILNEHGKPNIQQQPNTSNIIKNPNSMYSTGSPFQPQGQGQLP